MNRRWHLVLLVGLVLACLLPGFFTIPAVDRDEPRFAQASRQMVETGDYVVPRFGNEARFKKPIGIYWLQAAAARLSGYGAQAPIWVFRLPSLVAVFAVVLLTYGVGRRLFDPEAAFLAAALLGASLILSVEGRLAKTDAVQLVAAVAGQWALARFYLARNDEKLAIGWVLLFWGAMAAALLIKGPIVPLLAGLTIAALALWDRRAGWLKRLRPAIGVPFLLLLVLPWLIAIALRSGTDFFHQSVGGDLLNKVAQGQESHGAPPGAHFLVFWFAFWPGAALAAAAVPWVWTHRAMPAVRFAICWLVPFWIAFELIATKLPHYTLPTYPAIALLTAAAITAPRRQIEPLWMRVLALVSAVGGVLTAITALVVFRLLEGRIDLLPLALVLVVAAVAFAAARQALGLGLAAAARLLLVEAVVLYGLLFGLLVPRAEHLWSAPRLAAAVAQLAPCPKPELFVAGFAEPTMLFTFGPQITFGDGVGAADFLAKGGCRVAIVADNNQPLFTLRNRMRRQVPAVAQSLSGYNAANTRPISFNVYLASPAQRERQP